MRLNFAIQGYKKSGKDTSAEMLQFLLTFPSWMQRYWIFRNVKKFKLIPKRKYRITRYAEKLKQMLAVLFSLPLKYFEDQDIKESFYIDVETFDKISNPPKSKIMSDAKFISVLKNNADTITTNHYLSLRQLMQMFGTDVMRKHFNNNIWINATLKQKGNLIIADQRFVNENEAATKNGFIVLHITRPGYSGGQHASEREVKTLYEKSKYNYMIRNDGTLKDLFYKLKDLCNTIKMP